MTICLKSLFFIHNPQFRMLITLFLYVPKGSTTIYHSFVTT